MTDKSITIIAIVAGVVVITAIVMITIFKSKNDPIVAFISKNTEGWDTYKGNGMKDIFKMFNDPT